MDRRQQKTKEAILAAFNDLLSSKNYNKITVQNIIDRANVGRSTFYDHFQTKDDLLKEMCTSIFNHVFSEGLRSENSHDFSSTDSSISNVIAHIIYHLRDNKRNIIGILSCGSSEIFLGFFRQYLTEIFSKHLNYQEKADVPSDFVLNNFACSFICMIQWWIKGGMKESPEQLTAYFLFVNKAVV